MANRQQRADDGSRKESWAPGEIWEWIAILGAVAALWPTILGWHGLVWDATLLLALVLMIWVFIRRSRRLKSTWRK